MNALQVMMGAGQSASQGGGGGVTPFVEEDFSTYTSTANLLADPRGIYQAGEYIQSSQIALDTAVGFGSSTKSMRYDYPDRTGTGGSGTSGRCSDYTVSCSLEFPNGGNIQQVWVEFTFKTSVGFITQAPAGWSCTSDQGLKLLDGNVQPGDRFSVGLRTGLNPASQGQLWFGYPNNVTDAAGKVNFNAADGNWHTVRCYWKISTGYPGAPNANGAVKAWINGSLVYSATNLLTTSTAGNTPPQSFNFLSLARNINQGPDHAQSLYWGNVKIYEDDPEW